MSIVKQETTENQYKTNNSLLINLPSKKHYSSNNIVTQDYKKKNPLFRNAIKERGNNCDTFSTAMSFSSKDITYNLKLKSENKPESELKEKNLDEKCIDSDSEDSILESPGRTDINSYGYSSKNLMDQLKDNSYTVIEYKSLEYEKKEIPLEKGENEEKFFEFYLDIHFNTEDNYEAYVYSCLKASCYFPSNINWEEEIVSKKISLPYSDKKKTIFLDLDETLIHCDLEKQLDKFDVELKMENQSLPIIFRPYLKLFLTSICKDFELVIFTASKKDYADLVINAIDPDNQLFSYRIYRESNIFIKNGIYVKDLRIIDNRDLKNCVIVENNILSFINQLSNGILVPSFFDNPNDNYLTCLLGYLTNEVLNCDDVQKVNHESFSFENMKMEVYKI
jgi:Dullard-like phosphatase family protein